MCRQVGRKNCHIDNGSGSRLVVMLRRLMPRTGTLLLLYLLPSMQQGIHLSWGMRHADNQFRKGTFNRANQPVVGVSWYEAVAFCNWLSAKDDLTPAYNSSGQFNLKTSGYRLPTEVEWEYATAKGASTESERIYAYGNSWDCDNVVSSVSPCSRSETASVGSKSPAGDTLQGLADMSGNVWEWCTDNYQSNGIVSSSTDRYYFMDDQISTNFVLRGGSWDRTDKSLFRNAYRDYSNPNYRFYHIGFRVVRPE